MNLVSTAQLQRALVIREKIESLENELNSIMGGGETSVKGKRGPKKMSASARRKIAAAQTARWAKFHKLKGSNGAEPVKGKRKKMSPSARAKMAAVAKARWAKAKAAGKSSL